MALNYGGAIHAATHLLDPADTVQSAASYWRRHGSRAIRQAIAEQRRAIEHMQAMVAGAERVLAERAAAQETR